MNGSRQTRNRLPTEAQRPRNGLKKFGRGSRLDSTRRANLRSPRKNGVSARRNFSSREGIGCNYSLDRLMDIVITSEARDLLSVDCHRSLALSIDFVVPCHPVAFALFANAESKDRY